MRIPSSAPRGGMPPGDTRPRPADPLQQLLRLELQSLWSTRRLRTALLSRPAHPWV